MRPEKAIGPNRVALSALHRSKRDCLDGRLRGKSDAQTDSSNWSLFYNLVRYKAPMDEVLSIAEIGAKFDSEWVLIEDPRTDEALEVQGGTVRWHGKDREEVYRRAVELRPKRFAIVYTGKMPQDTAIVL
jgi:hypothetical protein